MDNLNSLSDEMTEEIKEIQLQRTLASLKIVSDEAAKNAENAFAALANQFREMEKRLSAVKNEDEA